MNETQTLTPSVQARPLPSRKTFAEETAPSGLRDASLWIYGGLALFFALCHGPDVFLLRDWHAAIFPLESIYMAKLLFFSQAGPMDVATSLMTPSNSIFIIAPAMYRLASLLGSLQHMYAFLFCVQMMVPLLFFRALKIWLPTFQAATLAFLSIFISVNAQWWSADYVLQPLLLLTVLTLWSVPDSAWTTPRFTAVGLLTSLMILLKQNEGLCWAYTLGALIFFHSIERGEEPRTGSNRGLFFAIGAAFLAMGFVFASKPIFTDERPYFVLPYFIFLGLAGYAVARNKSIGFRAGSFFKQASLFSLAALLLPTLVFLWIGSSVGYQRYAYSLFGMGLEFLPIWDKGIAGIIQVYAHLAQSASIHGLVGNAKGLVYLFLFMIPFLVNCMVTWKVFRAVAEPTPYSELRRRLLVGTISVFGIWMLFPLEGFHILSSKLTLFLTVLAGIWGMPSMSRSTSWLAVGVLVACLPLGLNAFSQSFQAGRMLAAHQAELFPNPIGLSVENTLAAEVRRQVATLQTTVHGRPYYIVDSSGGRLAFLMAMADNGFPAFYLEMRQGILDDRSTGGIIYSLQRVPFILVNLDDFDRYRSNQIADPHLRQILNFVARRYSEVARYDRPHTLPASSAVVSYVILQKNTKGQKR